MQYVHYAPYLLGVAGVTYAAVKYREWLKDQYANIRRHKVMFGMVVVLALLCGRMFHQNYEFQQPVVSKRAESYDQVWNGRATCLSQLPENQPDGMSANNAQALKDWNKPAVQPEQ